MARTVEGIQAGGDGTIIVTVVLPPDASGDPVSIRVPVEVSYPAVARADLTSVQDRV